MKNLLLVSLIINCFIQTSFGQTERPFKKGNILSGGSLAINFGSIKDFKPGIDPLPDVTYSTKSKTIESNLSLGYFVINQFALGFKCELLLSSETTNSSLTSETEWDIIKKEFLIGPILRYYTKPGIFIEGSTGISILKNISDDDDLKWIKYYWNTGIGYSILINKSIAIEPIINYRFLNSDIPEIEENEKLGELSIMIGFQIYLNSVKTD